MRFLRALALVMITAAGLALPAGAGSSPAISGGGVSEDMTRFALAIENGTGHFECLMPKLMTVEATVTGIDAISAGSASFHGTASVTLATANPFLLPAGPLVRGTPFTATATAGGPGVGQLDLQIVVGAETLDFPGTVEHGQITIQP
jgi:hypothetical protein